MLRLIVLPACILLAAGCAMTKPPLQREQGYPASWPDISSLGVECKGLDGTYANQGIVIDGKGNSNTISLSNILLMGNLTAQPTGPKSILLRVVTTHGKPDHDTFAKLLISFEGRNTEELGSCFCIKHALLCAAVHRSNVDIPYLWSSGSQQNIWFTKATDGSLLAKICGSSAGLSSALEIRPEQLA